MVREMGVNIESPGARTAPASHLPLRACIHLIWCMERRFPYQVRLRKTSGYGDTLQTFFNTRAPDRWANDARGYSVASLSDDFRRIWLVNLYSRRVNVGTGPVFSSFVPGEEPPPDEPPCGEGTTQPICPT